MPIILIAVVILLSGGFLSLAVRANPRLSGAFGAGSVVIAGVIGGTAAVNGLLAGGETRALSLPWSVPYGSFSVGLDAVSSLFLIPIFILTLLTAVYGVPYMKMHGDSRESPASWFHFCVLTASMVMVVIARNGILFLFAWEIMAISSFFLVTSDDKKRSVRDAGWIYFVAAHLGTGFILIMFALMAKETGTFDFDGWKNFPAALHEISGVLFILALIGFGTKAGIMPFHVWLPKAHPAAPSHVSAVMSGVMIKTGIYGIVRMIQFLGPPPAWWGFVLIGAGAISGVMGVLYALTRHDIKSLLAYHSVENIGIILMGLGLGLVGVSLNEPLIAVLGIGGALLHTVGHAIFKGLLFMGAGSVIARTATGEIDRLGGILKRMPFTGATFLAGAVSISGLPPFNGFISEFLIYAGAFACLGFFGTASGLGAVARVMALIVIAALVLIGGLAAACFSKVFGIVFLGEPRSESAKNAREVSIAMIAPKILLALVCLGIGLLAPLVLHLIAPAISGAGGIPPENVYASLAKIQGPVSYISLASALLISLSLIFLLCRAILFRRRGAILSGTWDCGYAAPLPTMQYTAASYARPIAGLFRNLLFEQISFAPPTGYFPGKASFASHYRDMFESFVFRPLFENLRRAFHKLRFLQHGDVNLYVLYIAIALLVLLIWKFGGA